MALPPVLANSFASLNMSPVADGHSPMYGHDDGTAERLATPCALLAVLADAEVTKGLNKRILREASDYRSLLAVIDEHGDHLHVLNICTLFHRLAKRLVKEGAKMSEKLQEIQRMPTWYSLLGLVKKHAPDCNNMELTNCLWAIATMDARGQAEEATASELLRVSMVYLETFEPRNLALSAWALAKMGYRDLEWCHKWAARVLRLLHDFQTRDMTMMVWAFATVHWRDDAFLVPFCEQVQMKCEQGGPQDIGNTLWALATLSFKHDGALAALTAQIFKKSRNL